jgi:hypothetical protein
MKRNFILTILSIVFISNLANATTRKVLFIGNSYIYTNDVPALLQAFANSMGDTLIYDQSTPGGQTLQGHCTNTTTISKIYSQQWDVVIVQEQSQRPAFSQAQVDSDVLPYATKLDSMIHDNNSCTQTMFMMTWGYKNGDASNCPVYPPICTYEGMQERLRESYMEMTQLNNAALAPVGAAWKVTRDSFPTIELYSPDNSHPVIAGSYLETCVLYASIFHKAPNLSTYYSSVPQADAVKLQNVATRVVLDSLNQWQQFGNYVFAGFNMATSSQTITLTNNSAEATSYAWDFGDASTSTAMTPPPHTYAANGAYVVKLTSSNSCFTETAKRTAFIGVSSVNNVSAEHNIKIYSGEQGAVTISALEGFDKIDIYSVNGQKVRSKELNGALQIKEELPTGIYTVHAYKNGVPAIIKFSVQ